MSPMASQITSLCIVYSTVYSGAYQRKHQSFASLTFVRRIYWGPVNSPHKRPVTRKCFHLMTSSCIKYWPSVLMAILSCYVEVFKWIFIHVFKDVTLVFMIARQFVHRRHNFNRKPFFFNYYHLSFEVCMHNLQIGSFVIKRRSNRLARMGIRRKSIRSVVAKPVPYDRYFSPFLRIIKSRFCRLNGMSKLDRSNAWADRTASILHYFWIITSTVNTLAPGDVYVHTHVNGSSLIQVMAWRMFGVKPLPQPNLTTHSWWRYRNTFPVTCPLWGKSTSHR